MEAELEKLQAVQDKHSKWEAQEEWLVQQLRELWSQLSASIHKHGEPCLAPVGSPGGVTSVVVNENRGAHDEDVTPSVATCPPQKDASTNHIGDVSATCSYKSTDKSNAASVDIGAANCMPTIDNEGSLLLAQQMPQIAKFSGEDLENEAFDDRLTQFEMIAG